MKKLFSSIASLATAVLTFVFLSIPCFTMTATVLGKSTTETTTGWELLQNADTYKNALTGEYFNGYMLYKIFAIIAIIIAGLLVITGLITLLQQFGIVKSKMNFCLINSILLTLYTIVALVALIGIAVLGNTFADMIPVGDTIKYGVGVGLILMLVVGAIATIISFLFARQKK